MKRFTDYLIAVIMLGAMTLSGCNYPGGTANPIQVSPTESSASIENAENVTATSQIPIIETTQTATITAQVITATPSVDSTLTPTLTETSSSNESCLDKAEFVKDISVSDGSLFSPGDTFEKTWRLRNVGTCTWTEQYQVVFAGGDQMDGVSPTSLPKVVPQGDTIDISISLTAPSADGSYQGKWQLQNQSGENFGIGEDAQTPIEVNIYVTQSVTGLELRTPTWEDTFKSDKYWYLLHTGNTIFSIKKGRLIMKAISSGKRDEWGLATRPDLENFYMVATFKTGDSCEGKDRYGLLVRATNQNSGYVYSFSCDGSFRFYRWDGENYYALQEWKQDSNILSGPNQVNRMSILAEDDTYKLYANGKLLGEYEDDSFYYGQFGLLIGSAETSDLLIYVEDIAYWIMDD